MSKKILIVGAGPIGCYLARLLKNKNSAFDITVIEEHGEIGRPVHCAGLVSRDVLSELKLDISQENVVINTIDGAEFFLNGSSFRINRKDVAFVIDRARFDQALGEGLGVKFNTRFVGIEKNGSGYLVETDKGEYLADIVIGADGANSTVRRVAGFKEDLELLRGVQFRIRHDVASDNLVRVHLKRPFFAWVIPENKNIVRAGIISSSPYHDLLQFLDAAGIRGEILEKFAGFVPLGNCVTQNGSIFLVGDAAAQVKPLTHGGIYYGMRCAEILADSITREKPYEYEVLWRRRFEEEINIAAKAKGIYQRLSDENIEKFFALLKNNTEILESFGDFENHSKAIKAVLKNPHLQTVLAKILIDIIKDIHLDL